jgi:hypothetical protein
VRVQWGKCQPTADEIPVEIIRIGLGARGEPETVASGREEDRNERGDPPDITDCNRFLDVKRSGTVDFGTHSVFVC